MDKRFRHGNVLRAVERTLDEARSAGSPPVCLAICDTTGNMIHFSRMHGAPERAVNIAWAKARTAALMEVPTRAVCERMRAEGLRLEDFCGAALTRLAGGIPLRQDGGTWGGIGVSGSKVDDDETLALRCAALLQE